MKIAATMVSMDAARNYTEVDQYNTGWQQGNITPVSFSQTSLSSSGATFQQRLFTLLQSSSSSSQSGTCSITSGENITDDISTPASAVSEHAQGYALSAMVQQVTGASVQVNQVQNVQDASSGITGNTFVNQASFYASAVHVEQESVSFHAQGAVQTDNGETISFSMGVQMQRQEIAIQWAGLSQTIQGIDPIVLNFEDDVSLCDQTYFSFDLDGDGTCEEIPGLGSGSGFLALDRDHDGLISNGLELFGPSTGSGFAELAELDDDGNGWIDENDAIFDHLKVWFAAGGEEERLVSLREAGVGAISVANVGTQFTLEDENGQVQGIVRANGLFLMENGEPRSLQEIDLVPRQDQELGQTARQDQEFGQTVEAPEGDEPVFAAVERLREIIFWQRFRLQMMLANKRLGTPVDELVERLKFLSADYKGNSLS
ncbi:hypothetical protein [Desulfogranum japonicum]|uniref:hypothetical protein n=1 Tax=Desulfogranum japonicum TaxID=231447 RepID=UPI0004155B2C|nr:hypothetical protein [Desulfogranum japonicum]